MPPLRTCTFNRNAIAFRRGIAAAGLIGDSYASRAEWTRVRKTAEALFTEGPAHRQTFSDHGMHAEGTGYLLEFGKRQLFAMVPARPGPEFPLANGQPQVIMTRPRTKQECAFVYRLMEECHLGLQMCPATGYKNVYPPTVSLDDVLAEKKAAGATRISLGSISATAFRVNDGAELSRFLRSITGRDA